MGSPSLNVIALISGGKDSMYSISHCIAHGHTVVALANLAPTPAVASASISGAPQDGQDGKDDHSNTAAQISTEGEQDMNSFMYQTAGHSLIDLYRQCIPDIPLYRRSISGSAVVDSREYRPEKGDETEDMMSLLRDILHKHPEANAICSGAILSTYQRTRVESVAVRLGLTPLAFLWQYPELPTPPGPTGSSLQSEVSRDKQDPAALLRHMSAVGIDARIVKVASAGLDESFLWLNLCNENTIRRLERAISRFGGSVLGEGGEFETLVVNGPSSIWAKQILVDSGQQCVVKGDGGEATLNFSDGKAVGNRELDAGQVDRDKITQPDLFDALFKEISIMPLPAEKSFISESSFSPMRDWVGVTMSKDNNVWSISNITARRGQVEAEMRNVCEQLIDMLSVYWVVEGSVFHVLVILRDMSEFPFFNQVYQDAFANTQQPLPPSRVTIACGSSLPENCNVMLSAWVAERREPYKQGLHVQSRSYWAPANIGPYSQARKIQLYDRSNDFALAASSVYIAGQIPLVPSTMDPLMLPAGSKPEGFELFQNRAALALQHLWRIGIEQKVGFWTGAVAYLAQSSDFEARASIVRQVWTAANARQLISREVDSEVDDEDEDFDIWDRVNRSQPAWASGGGTGQDLKRPLPDWSNVATNAHLSSDGATPSGPPCIAIEVDALPRGSDIEWQSHGLAVDSSATKSDELKYFCSSEENKHDTQPESIVRSIWKLGICTPGKISNGQRIDAIVYHQVTVLEIGLDFDPPPLWEVNISEPQVAGLFSSKGKRRAQMNNVGHHNIGRAAAAATPSTKLLVQLLDTPVARRTLVYATRGHSVFAQVGATVVPCRRIRGHDGAELAAAIFITSSDDYHPAQRT